VFIIYSKLDALHDRPLPLCANLLRTLEGDQRHLQVVRGLLKSRLLVWLNEVKQ